MENELQANLVELTHIVIKGLIALSGKKPPSDQISIHRPRALVAKLATPSRTKIIHDPGEAFRQLRRM